MKSDWEKVCTIPNFEGLRSKDFTKFIIEELDGLDYLPDNFVEYTPNRNWLANICKWFKLFIFYRKFSWYSEVSVLCEGGISKARAADFTKAAPDNECRCRLCKITQQ